MTEEAVEQMRQRMMNQGRRFRSQRIPLYRLMKKANVKAVLVEPFNGLEKTRYLRD
jgi:hypothetical protein